MGILDTRPGFHRTWVYPLQVKGRFHSLRRWTMLALQAFFFLTPWLSINGRRLLMLDVAERKLHIAGLLFTSTDNEFILLLLLLGAFGLFLVTSLFGRVWCGYACPQTVFLEQWFMPVERWIEGGRGVRMRRDTKGKGTFDWWWRKVAKFSAFALMCTVLGMTLTSFFDDPKALWTGQASWVAYGAAFVFGGAAFADYAWFRDQFCSYLCPYARFQGALTDDESWVISYDVPRGEPRHKGKRKKPEQGACIDCNKCVAVCPQGIDIRDGYQLECTSCTRCVDACEGVMAKMGEPSLVRYSSEVEDQGGGKVRFFRPRTMVYVAIMVTLSVIFGLLLSGRHELAATVSRAPGAMYQVDLDGNTRNTYMLQVENRSTSGEAVQVQVTVDGLPESAALISIPMLLAEGESKTIPLVVTMPVDGERVRTLPFEFVVSTPEDSVSVGASFKSGN